MTMLNTYYLMADVRSNLHEVSQAHWSDKEILRKLNQVQTDLAMHLMLAPGAWLLKTASLVFAAGEATLPSDCAKPVHLIDNTLCTPIPIRRSVGEKRCSTLPVYYSDAVHEAWLERGKIVVNIADYAETCTLWYHESIPDLHGGTAGASSATSALHLDVNNEPKFADDYYNGCTVEVIGQTTGVIDISSIVSDYVGSTKIMTIAGTPASGDYYGTISKLPGECYSALVLGATVRCLAKPSATVDEKCYDKFLLMQKDSWSVLKQWINDYTLDERHTRITETAE